MEEIIVFGLGADWELNKSIIEQNYKVIGMYDNNVEKVKNIPIKIESIDVLKTSSSKIMITSSKYEKEILSQLLKEGISKERLIIFSELEISKLFWGRKPFKGFSYSGEYEDWLIDAVIQRIEIPYSEMKYIELGVMDPIKSSNTFYFYERGAKGILVEANPDLLPYIKEVRSRDIIINKAIFEYDDCIIPFYISNEPGLSSVYEKHIEEDELWKELGILKKIEVETISINTVFGMLDGVDLLSIDLEGFDYEALSKLDFRIYRPKIIVAELNWFHISGRELYQTIVDLLYQNDYELYYQNKYNGIFIDKRII